MVAPFPPQQPQQPLFPPPPPGLMPGMPLPGMGLNPGTPLPPPATPPMDMAAMVAGQLQPPGSPPLPGMPGMAPTPVPLGDPILGQMESLGPPSIYNAEISLPTRLKKGYIPKLDAGIWKELANQDEQHYQRLIWRFGRDVDLWRGRNSAVPPGFDVKRELAYRSASFSNIINKLTNMCAPLDFRYVVPYKDEPTQKASQIVENWHIYNRSCEEFEYATSGGHSSLAQDEWFYNLLFGRICCRILPAPERPHHPFQMTLIDPSTVFPVWGGDGEGLVRITHKRPMLAIDVISTYLPYAPNLTERIKDAVASKFGFDSQEYHRYYYVENDLLEIYNTWSKAVFWGGMEIDISDHELGFVPWVYTMARGEPRGMSTPASRAPRSALYDHEDDPDDWSRTDAVYDEAEKGISVFHHIIKTNKQVEVVYSLLMTQILQASRPATINYVGQTGWGQLPKALDVKPGGTNYRRMNVDNVEIVPVSPRPTDASPVINKLLGEMAEGSLNPAAFGNVEGSNIAGYAIETMVAQAKDTVLPYMRNFELFQAMKSEMQMRLYEQVILPEGVMTVPMEGRYGSRPSEDVTQEIIDQVGPKVTVELIGVSDQQLPMLVNAAGAAVERGFWSQRKAMEKLGEKDPDRMLREIIIERGMQHPEMMENFLIPVMMIKNGQRDMAEMWTFLVVMPKVQQMMSQMMGPMAGMMGGGGGPPGGPPGAGLAAGGPGGGGPPAMLPAGPGGPEVNGQSNPNALRARGAPTGPEQGQGRGPAPQPLMS